MEDLVTNSSSSGLRAVFGAAAASSLPDTPASKAVGWLSGSRISEPMSAATALDPWTDPNLFTAARIGDVIEDVRGDIRDAARLDSSMRDSAPRSSSTSPRSRWSATPTRTPSAPTRPMSSAPRACSTPSAAPLPSAPSSRSPPTSATRTRSGSGLIARPILSAAMIPTPVPRPAPRSSPPPSASRTSPSTN